MKGKLIIAFALCAFSLFAGEPPPLSPSDLSKERILPESKSPNGQFCFIEGNVGPTTRTAIVLASTDLQRVFAGADLATRYSTDKPYKGRIVIVWNSASDRVATHDNSAKQSRVSIFRASEGGFATVPVPDLLEAACQAWGVKREAILTSGQRPTKWTAPEVLAVEVAAKVKGGKERTIVLQVEVPESGAAVIRR